MDFPTAGWVIANILGFAIPTLAVVAKFGATATANSASGDHMLVLVGGAVFGFAASMLGSWFLRKRHLSGPQDIVTLFGSSRTDGADD